MVLSRAFILALTALACLQGVAAQAQSFTPPTRQELDSKGIKPLTGDELRTLLTENTLFHINPANGVRVPLLYRADGTRYVKIRDKVLKSNWRIERDMVCEYSVVLNRDVCRTLFRSNGYNAVCEEGEAACSFGLDWAAGNPAGLGQ
ncbi:hypothetical protein [Arenibaculum pallidiluteum]|uniref:hypothetical protein n=1 Tax=Arenibaculum pallidiluteum TaxID=2812559 RepID=UPI001A978939|nr:hypothetical protein [Arenibaculum pallidiluteum]